MESLLKPKRITFSDAMDAQYEARGGRCEICTGELRCGEDHGDHIHQFTLLAPGLVDALEAIGGPPLEQELPQHPADVRSREERREAFDLAKVIDPTPYAEGAPSVASLRAKDWRL